MIAREAEDAGTFRRLGGYGAIVDDGAGRYHPDTGERGTFRGAVQRRIAAIAPA